LGWAKIRWGDEISGTLRRKVLCRNSEGEIRVEIRKKGGVDIPADLGFHCCKSRPKPVGQRVVSLMTLALGPFAKKCVRLQEDQTARSVG
jgi:hypothetical protein